MFSGKRVPDWLLFNLTQRIPVLEGTFGKSSTEGGTGRGRLSAICKWMGWRGRRERWKGIRGGQRKGMRNNGKDYMYEK